MSPPLPITWERFFDHPIDTLGDVYDRAVWRVQDLVDPPPARPAPPPSATAIPCEQYQEAANNLALMGDSVGFERNFRLFRECAAARDGDPPRKDFSGTKPSKP